MSYGPFVTGLAPAERKARCRALRTVVVLLMGREHELVVLARAEADDVALQQAVGLVEGMAALPRRKLLGAYAAVAR
jgi:hypothetical protein